MAPSWMAGRLERGEALLKVEVSVRHAHTSTHHALQALADGVFSDGVVYAGSAVGLTRKHVLNVLAGGVRLEGGGGRGASGRWRHTWCAAWPAICTRRWWT